MNGDGDSVKFGEKWKFKLFSAGLVVVFLFFAYQKIYLKDRGVTVKNIDVGIKPNYDGLNLTSVFYQDLKSGSGLTAGSGATVTIKYTLWIYDPRGPGNRGPSLIGEGNFIQTSIVVGKGKSEFADLESRLEGLRKGTKRILVIPSEMVNLLNIKNLPRNGVALMFEIETVTVE